MTDPITVQIDGDGEIRALWDRVQEKAFLLMGPSPHGVSADQTTLIFLLSTFRRVFPAAEGGCRHCHRPVAYRPVKDRYCHIRPEVRSLTWGWSDVGCYAASYDWLDGDWDDDIDRSLMAELLP